MPKTIKIMARRRAGKFQSTVETCCRLFRAGHHVHMPVRSEEERDRLWKLIREILADEIASGELVLSASGYRLRHLVRGELAVYVNTVP